MTAPDPSRVEAIALLNIEHPSGTMLIGLALAKRIIAADPATARLAELEGLLAECRALLEREAYLAENNGFKVEDIRDLLHRLGARNGCERTCVDCGTVVGLSWNPPADVEIVCGDCDKERQP